MDEVRYQLTDTREYIIMNISYSLGERIETKYKTHRKISESEKSVLETKFQINVSRKYN